MDTIAAVKSDYQSPQAGLASAVIRAHHCQVPSRRLGHCHRYFIDSLVVQVDATYEKPKPLAGTQPEQLRKRPSSRSDKGSETPLGMTSIRPW